MRRARLTTDHDTPEAATRVARALVPDNTAEMATRVEGSRVVTTIERSSTGSLHATVDDYIVNLQLAADLGDEDGTTATGDDTADVPPDTTDTHNP